MKRKLLIIISLVCFACMTHAKPYERVFLKDGTVLEGYICRQLLGKSLSVMTDDHEVMVSNKDVARIARISRGYNEQSGIVDVIETESYTIRGQIVEIIPGKQIKVLADDGYLQDIENKDIFCHRREALDKDKSLISQVPYVETIMMNDGEKYVGVIVYQDYSAVNKKVRILDENDGEYFVNLMDVREISKAPYSHKVKVSKTPEHELLNEDVVKIAGKQQSWLKKSELKFMDKDAIVFNHDSIAGKLEIVCKSTIDNVSLFESGVNSKTDYIKIKKEYEMQTVEEKQEGDIVTMTYAVNQGYYILIDRTANDKVEKAVLIKIE